MWGYSSCIALISKAFDRVWYAGLFHKLRSYGFQVRFLALFLLFSVIGGFLDDHSSQEYWVNAGVPLGSIPGPTVFLLYINDIFDGVICNISAIYAGDTTLYSKCNQASNLWQQPELASELESDVRDTVDWGKKWLVDFSARKL